MDVKQSAEYIEGWNVFTNTKKPSHTNPYRMGTPEYNRWLRGWMDAQSLTIRSNPGVT